MGLSAERFTNVTPSSLHVEVVNDFTMCACMPWWCLPACHHFALYIRFLASVAMRARDVKAVCIIKKAAVFHYPSRFFSEVRLVRVLLIFWVWRKAAAFLGSNAVLFRLLRTV